MGKSVCGLDCGACDLRGSCGGCAESGGKPFGGLCMVAECCKGREQAECGQCSDVPCGLRKRLMAEFNALGIEDMEEVRGLNALLGSYINMEYRLPGGQAAKFWEDDRIYLGNQVCKKGGDRYYGLAADEKYLLVCEYGENGADAEIVAFKRWNTD